jgi:hypothetical protein
MTERRLGDYLRYAAGEIVLVVIGILIALQINNWNEDRIEQNQVRVYAQALAGDLARDLQMLVPVDAQIRTLLRQIDELADYARGKPIAQLANSELFFYTYDWAYRPYAWNRAALERLKASGTLQAMHSPELIAKITAYDALTHHLDQDFLDDGDMIRAAGAYADRVRNRNYPQLGAARTYFARIPDGDYENEFFRFKETDTYRQMQALNLPLLTNDLTDVQVMVNAMLDIRTGLSPRVEGELPRLRKMSAEITALVEAEYR